eukprot:Ihof_evm12s108 gene=Ihof_evmTU12s108
MEEIEEKSPWVEINEDSLAHTVYVNQDTLECRWELPEGYTFRKSSGDQWWELYDEPIKQYCYYNSHTAKTRWEKPENCDIIPLARLQELQAATQEGKQMEMLANMRTRSLHDLCQVVAKRASQCASRWERGEEERPRCTSMREPREKPVDLPPPPANMESFGSLLAEQIETKHSGGLFKRRQTLEARLTWSKCEIYAPITKLVPRRNKKEALECFKCVMMYMGDRPMKRVTPVEIAHYLAAQGYNIKPMRDELFVQLVKQMTLNPK